MKKCCGKYCHKEKEPQEMLEQSIGKLPAFPPFGKAKEMAVFTKKQKYDTPPTDKGWEEMYSNIIQSHKHHQDKSGIYIDICVISAIKSFITSLVEREYTKGFIAGADSTATQISEISAEKLKDAIDTTKKEFKKRFPASNIIGNTIYPEGMIKASEVDLIDFLSYTLSQTTRIG